MRAIRPWIVPVNARIRHARDNPADTPGTISRRIVLNGYRRYKIP
ncbi:MAG: hypothetical protein NTZ37_09200 [Methanoregula sp.]|nr:hypothetical protein [Methanoregula sp.]